VQSADEVILQAGDCVAIKPGFSTPADADFTAEIKTQPVPQFTYYLYDHLGNTRITYSVEVKAADDMDYTVQSATDYYPYGKALRSYGKERVASMRHQLPVGMSNLFITGNIPDGLHHAQLPAEADTFKYHTLVLHYKNYQNANILTSLPLLFPNLLLNTLTNLNLKPKCETHSPT